MGNSRWRLADRTLQLDRPFGVGIVNVTEDSMYEGARSGTPGRAVEDGLALIDAGFEMLDVGAVAARSGPPVPTEEEAERLLPAIEGLAAATEVPLSADTFSAAVADARSPRERSPSTTSAALPIRRCSSSPPPVAAGWWSCTSRVAPREDRVPRRYEDPIDHLKGWFTRRLEEALAHEVSEEQVVLDPGLDFDLTVADDLEILRRMDELRELGRPLFVSLSRKDFLGALLAGSWEERFPAERREWATAAVTALAVAAGADVLRLHDQSALQAMRIAGAIRRERAEVVDG